MASLPYKLFRGYKIPKGADENNWARASDHRPQPGDALIVSYPKCGTTWLQSIVYYLLFKKDSGPVTSIGDIVLGVPFPEQDGFPTVNRHYPALKFHLPVQLMQPLDEKGRYLYIARNPKDACVSTYHFLKNLPGYEIENFDHFFDAFVSGEVPYGDIMDHVLNWYSLRHRPNVLFMTYESLFTDRKRAIENVAGFLNVSLDDSQIRDILTYTSFDYMRDLAKKDNFYRGYLNKSTGDLKSGKNPANKEPQMLRKGIVGDWRNHFSENQNSRMNQYIRRKAEGTDLLQLWRTELEL